MEFTHSRKAIIVVFLILLVVLFAYLIPAIAGSQEENISDAYNVNSGTENTVTGEVHFRVISIQEGGQQNVNVSLSDGTTSEYVSLSPGERETVQLSNEDITVENSDVIGENNAVLVFEYQIYTGWPNGAELLINNIVMILLLTLLLLIVAVMLVLFLTTGES